MLRERRFVSEVDCCKLRGSFTCDDVGDPSVHGGYQENIPPEPLAGKVCPQAAGNGLVWKLS
eukprot:5365919-Amphidinium_carterae.2